MRQESHEEFAARMDRARAEDAATKNRATLGALVVYAIILAGYFFIGGTEIRWLATVLILLDSILAFVVVRLIISVHKSRKL